ncbi:hypothetical protein [Geobacter sp. DSM 9736]|uniref:hypothetical protein n=1 Tax=Geobacter sp. DSM 9736 TaxID=1277350 RepID=UPI000B513C9B|nr:hypothetical protein [Geobacter sp. DSM 9736]SNB45729.1 hypothetical protein SAMN06269301_1157 [Geobacter sp. DSM 9736]
MTDRPGVSVHKVRLRVSPAAARLLNGEAGTEEKLKAARGEGSFPTAELAVVLVVLSRDHDERIRSAALAALQGMSHGMLLELVLSPETHPKVLDALARIHRTKEDIILLIMAHPLIDKGTRDFIAAAAPPNHDPDTPNGDLDPASEDEILDVPDDEGEEFRSKHSLAQELSITEKIKYAMTGDKEWRSILLRDTNKLVSGAVLKNPRITDQEIEVVARSSTINDEAVRLICCNKDWIKNYRIRKALVENSKTPLPVALRFLSTLSERDLSMLAKSRNISSVIAAQARKMLNTIQKKR